MPFDWNESKMGHVSVVHVETHFPKDFAEFLSPSYSGYVNDPVVKQNELYVHHHRYNHQQLLKI